MSKWKEFEQLVHQLQQQLSGDAEVILNTHLKGDDSKGSRQIDILVKRSVAQYPIVIVMECKDYKRPVDVKEVEAFATKLRDVKANKGALVSGKGFTSMALEVAERYGIDVFRFIDTQSTNWKAYASIPAAVEQIALRAVQFRFSEFIQIPIAYVRPLQNAEIFSKEKEYLGKLENLMTNKWINGEIPKTTGIHEIEIIKNGFIGEATNLVMVTIHGLAHVEKKFFHGPLPVDLIGLKDERSGGVLTKSFTTKMIETSKLIDGKLEGWLEVVDPSKLAVAPIFTFVVESSPKIGESYKSLQ